MTLDLDRLEALEKAASKPPWLLNDDGEIEPFVNPDQAQADCELIVEMRNSLRQLLSMARDWSGWRPGPDARW